MFFPPPLSSECPTCGFNCTCDSFVYKRFPNGLQDGTPPSIILPKHDPTWPDPTTLLSYSELHVSPLGNFHIAGRAYDHLGNLLYAIDPPEENARWLWIDDDANLYGVRSVEEPGAEGSGRKQLRMHVWKYVRATATTSLIIDLVISIQPGITYWDSFFFGSGFHNRWVKNDFNNSGGFDQAVTSRLGDVRHGRIVIAGTANWYEDSTEDLYDGNAEIRCWDLDGTLQWSCEIGDDYYGTDDIFVYDPDTGNTAGYPVHGQPYYMGFPRPVRVRIAEDKGVWVLTEPSRSPPDYRWKYDPNRFYDIGLYLRPHGENVEPCLWKVSDDVTGGFGSPLPQFRFYSRWNGVIYDDIKIEQITLPEDVAVQNGITPPTLTVLNHGEDTYGLFWTDASGGTPPYTYDIYKNDVLLASGVSSPYDDGPLDKDSIAEYYIKTTDSTGGEAVSNIVAAVRVALSVRQSSAVDFDVDASGNVIVRLLASDGLHRVEYLDSTEDPELITVGAEVTAGGLNETQAVPLPDVFRGGYAGPVYLQGDPNRFYMLIPTPAELGTGTDLAEMSFTYAAEDEYIGIRRRLSCDVPDSIRLERTAYSLGSENTVHVATGDAQPVSDYDCQPCDVPEDESCSLCPPTTMTPDWDVAISLDPAIYTNTTFGADAFACIEAGGGGTAALVWENPHLRPATVGTGETCRWERCDWPSAYVRDPQIDCGDGCLPINQLPPVTMSDQGGITYLDFWAFAVDDGALLALHIARYSLTAGDVCGPTATFGKIMEDTGGNYFPAQAVATRSKRRDCNFPVNNHLSPCCPDRNEYLPAGFSVEVEFNGNALPEESMTPYTPPYSVYMGDVGQLCGPYDPNFQPAQDGELYWDFILKAQYGYDPVGNHYNCEFDHPFQLLCKVIEPGVFRWRLEFPNWDANGTPYTASYDATTAECDPQVVLTFDGVEVMFGSVFQCTTQLNFVFSERPSGV